MPEINSQNFESERLGIEIEKISKEIKEKKGLPEYKEKGEKEILKETLEPLVKPKIAPPKISPPPKVLEVLPDYLKDAPEEIKTKVENFVGLVFEKGIKKTAREVQKSGAFFVDAFHDALTDKLYEELKKRKLI